MFVQRNIIRKSVLELNFNGRVDGLSLHKEINEWYTREMMPQLEQLLEPYSADAYVVKIDELSLTVAIDKKENWQKDLTQQILLQIQQKLQKMSGGITKEVVRQTAAEGFFELFIFFLQKGYLPWWSTIKTKEEGIEKVQAWLEESSEGFPNRWKTVLENEDAQKRLINFLPPDVFESLMQKIIPHQKSFLSSLFQDVITVSDVLPPQDKMPFHQQCQQILLKNLFVASFEKAMIRDIAALLAKSEIVKLKQGAALSFQIADLQQALQSSETKNETRKHPAEIKEKASAPHQHIESKQLIKDGEEMYIDNSGLVIIAPFLTTFFSRLHLYENEKINDIPAALLLLYYLSTGKDEPAEFEWVLPKILCGLDISTAVNMNVSLSSDQKKEADELLRSAIEHWHILKDTSVAGFREAFLQRTGKLSFRNGEWLLQVEQKAYDLLLQHLPWNIYFIKLPWMKQILKTEWT